MLKGIAKICLLSLILMPVLLTPVLSTFSGCVKKWNSKSGIDKVKAPPETKNWVNPIRAASESLATGKDLYIRYCARCHGISGDGNGEEGKELEPKSTSFTNPKIQAQTDGELFWKITHREGPMGGWNKRLHDEDRWHLVNFLRIFGQPQ